MRVGTDGGKKETKEKELYKKEKEDACLAGTSLIGWRFASQGNLVLAVGHFACLLHQGKLVRT